MIGASSQRLIKPRGLSEASTYQGDAVLKKSCVLALTTALAGCGDNLPTCGDEAAVKLATDMVVENALKNVSDKSVEGELRKNLKLANIVTTAHDEKLGSYSCKTTVQFQMPTEFKQLMAWKKGDRATMATQLCGSPVTCDAYNAGHKAIDAHSSAWLKTFDRQKGTSPVDDDGIQADVTYSIEKTEASGSGKRGFLVTLTGAKEFIEVLNTLAPAITDMKTALKLMEQKPAVAASAPAGNQASEPAKSVNVSTAPAVASDSPAMATNQSSNRGEVKSVTSAGGYTYLEVNHSSGTVWVAAPEVPVKVGDTVQWGQHSVMKDFTARSLNRKFDELLFADAVSVVK